MAVWSVRWRAGSSCASLLSRSRWRASRSSRAPGASTFVRAAASSIASGKPSRRIHNSATACALFLSNVKPGRTARARSTKRATAGTWDNSSEAGRSPRSGTGKGATGCSRSQFRCSGWRLVARTRTPGQVARGAPHVAQHGPRARSCPEAARSVVWPARPSDALRAADQPPQVPPCKKFIQTHAKYVRNLTPDP